MTAEQQAAEITGTLWAAIYAAGGVHRPVRAGHQLYPDALDGQWLASLPLPIDQARPPQAPVALLNEADEFERHDAPKALAVAYANHPRTRVYEDIGRDAPESWYALTARHLGRLTRCDLQVVCSIFQSAAGDQSLGAHFDTWYGAIIQISGAKTWTIGPGLLNDSGPPVEEVVTRPGDVLLLPKGLPHAVTTPPDPGHSVHLTFAIDRDDHPTPSAQGALQRRGSSPREGEEQE
jgi:hypothetical protein